MRALNFFIYSNLFIALLLSFLTVASYALIEQPPKWYVVLSVFLGSFTLYSFHRLYKIDFIPKELRGNRRSWISKHSAGVKIGMGLAVFISMLILPNFTADDIVWLTPAGILSIGYTIPIIPTDKKWWRLRDIPLMKPIIIAAVVSYVTLLFPIFEHYGIDQIFKPKNITLFLERSVFLLAMTIPFEMRDETTDRQAGLKTLATYLGFDFAKKLSFSAILLWLILWLWRSASTHSLIAALFGVAIFIISIVLFACLQRDNTGLYYILGFEGLIVFYALGIFLIF